MIFVDHTKAFLNTLFSGFPREVGFPARQLLNSFDEFLSVSHSFHLSSPVFVQLYRIDQIKNEVEIDKLWVDLDGRNQYQLMSDLKVIYDRLIEMGFNENDIVPVFTGSKGFHIYAKIKPIVYSIPKAKDCLKWILSYLCRDLETPDSPLFGDINRVVRVAGIQRPEGTFMFCLSPKHVFKYKTINDYLVKHRFAWKKLVHIGSNYLNRMNSGTSFKLSISKTNIEQTGFVLPKQNHFINDPSRTSTISPITKNTDGDYFEFLKTVMGDTPLFYAIHAPNPRHIDRVRFAVKLLKMKLPLVHCCDIMESLKWLDWNAEVTNYQLKNIKDKYNL